MKVNKKVIVFVWAGLLVIAACCYVEYKVQCKCKYIVSELETLSYSSQMLFAGLTQVNDYTFIHSQPETLLSSDTLKVVCLGNSITKHPYKPEVEWYADWGMAASKEEFDYCHVLQRRLRKYCSYASVTPLNIYQFEVNPTCNLDSLLGDCLVKANVVVIRLGENVQNITLFSENIQRLVDKCLTYTPNVIITGNFWMNSQKEKILINAAYDNHLRFVPLSWIAELREVYPKKGDTIYSIEGKPYTLASDFVLMHPNDEGMENIADAIFNAITYIIPMNNNCENIDSRRE